MDIDHIVAWFLIASAVVVTPWVIITDKKTYKLVKENSKDV